MNIKDLPPATKALWFHWPVDQQSYQAEIARATEERWRVVDVFTIGMLDTFVLLEKGAENEGVSNSL